MTNYVENVKECVKNIKKYIKNMKEYVNILDLALPYLYGPWDLEKFHARASSWVLGLGKILSSASIQALEFEKMLSLPFLRSLLARCHSFVSSI